MCASGLHLVSVLLVQRREKINFRNSFRGVRLLTTQANNEHLCYDNLTCCGHNARSLEPNPYLCRKGESRVAGVFPHIEFDCEHF